MTLCSVLRTQSRREDYSDTRQVVMWCFCMSRLLLCNLYYTNCLMLLLIKSFLSRILMSLWQVLTWNGPCLETGKRRRSLKDTGAHDGNLENSLDSGEWGLGQADTVLVLEYCGNMGVKSRAGHLCMQSLLTKHKGKFWVLEGWVETNVNMNDGKTHETFFKLLQ